MEFTTNSLLFLKDPKSTIAANHASNYRYKIVHFALLSILKQVVLQRTLQNTKFIILVWVFVDDDSGDNEMIMSTIRNGLYGSFGAILKILATENGKSKNEKN